MKRIIALLLTCVLIASALSACGNSNTTTEGRTLFIYMCGSNLETKQGLASKNIDELLSADKGDTNIVIQTGGANTWRHHNISSSKSQRYEIKDGKLNLLESFEQKNMGEAETLTDFLKWGQEKYPTNHNMLILWDHGGGSAKGVCFDENYSFDALTLTELNSALKKAKLKNKYDIIGFDACLMASIETAYTVKDYAKYMIASEEIVPSGGWDYKSVVTAFASGKSEKKIGRQICDSYMQKCKKSGKEKLSTLSVLDLSYTDKMLKEFKLAVEIIQKALYDKELSGEVIHALKNVKKFGSGSDQGSSNMIDIIDVFDHAPSLTAAILPGHKPDELTELWEAISHFVTYNKTNIDYCNVRGVSFYYPISYNKDEIDSYIDLDLIEPYNKFLKAFYQNIPDKTIAFTDKGSIGKDGAFTVSFTPKSVYYLSSVDYILMSTDSHGVRHVLRTDNNITVDQERIKYKSNFNGRVSALDGHRMFTTTLNRVEDDYIEYNAPVIVNGKKTTLLFDFIYNFEDDENGGYYMMYGTWDGYDENGLPSGDYNELKKGDKVKVLTETKTVDGKHTEIYSDEFTIGKDGGKISEIPLGGQSYQYVFVASDLFGNTITSDTATFEMTKSYKELLKKPLPDGEYAAKVTKTEKYKAE